MIIQPQKGLVIGVCGPQGSGKEGTRRTLAKVFSLVQYGMSDILKEKRDSDPVFKARYPYTPGKLYPFEAVEEAFRGVVNKYPNNTSFVFDGVPRGTTNQVDLLLKYFPQETHDIAFVNLVCPRRDCEQRIEGRRAARKNAGLEERDDDKPHIVKGRLDEHFMQFGAILDYVQKVLPQSIIDIDARPPQDEVLAAVVSAVDKKRKELIAQNSVFSLV